MARKKLIAASVRPHQERFRSGEMFSLLAPVPAPSVSRVVVSAPNVFLFFSAGLSLLAVTLRCFLGMFFG